MRPATRATSRVCRFVSTTRNAHAANAALCARSETRAETRATIFRARFASRVDSDHRSKALDEARDANRAATRDTTTRLRAFTSRASAHVWNAFATPRRVHAARTRVMATARCLKRASTTPRQARKHVVARLESVSANARITKCRLSAFVAVKTRHREKQPSRTRRPTRARARAAARRASRARLPEAAHPRKQSLLATFSRRMRSRAEPEVTRLFFARAFSQSSCQVSNARNKARL